LAQLYAGQHSDHHGERRKREGCAVQMLTDFRLSARRVAVILLGVSRSLVRICILLVAQGRWRRSARVTEPLRCGFGNQHVLLSA